MILMVLKSSKRKQQDVITTKSSHDLNVVTLCLGLCRCQKHRGCSWWRIPFQLLSRARGSVVIAGVLMTDCRLQSLNVFFLEFVTYFGGVDCILHFFCAVGYKFLNFFFSGIVASNTTSSSFWTERPFSVLVCSVIFMHGPCIHYIPLFVRAKYYFSNSWSRECSYARPNYTFLIHH